MTAGPTTKGSDAMRTRPRHLLLAATATALTLVLTSCGGGGGGGGLAGSDEQQQGVNDINPLPRDQVRDGGDLRWPLDAIPDNFNRNQLDGTLLENREVMQALMPGAFVVAPDATLAVDEDYFTSIELTSQDPQVVTYTINPDATWDDGVPISWQDLQAQWQASNGTNPAFLVATTTGWEDIASVERGVDDKQAVITFARPYAEWRGLYEELYPASTNRDPATFNEGWIERPLTTAGPFRVDNVDQTAQTITLVRNDRWWGETAKLDRIIFRVTDRAALADALANNEIDFYNIGSDVNLFQRARGIQGIEVRQATEPTYNHITFNGGPGAILADPALRRAVAQGINRQAVADALIGQIVPDVTPLGNYLYVQGSGLRRPLAGDRLRSRGGAGRARQAGLDLPRRGPDPNPERTTAESAVRDHRGQPDQRTDLAAHPGSAPRDRGRRRVRPGGLSRPVRRVRDPGQLRHGRFRLLRHAPPGQRDAQHLRDER